MQCVNLNRQQLIQIEKIAKIDQVFEIVIFASFIYLSRFDESIHTCCFYVWKFNLKATLSLLVSCATKGQF